MFKNIMIPVDLAHADTLDKAMEVAGRLAKEHGAKLHLVSVTGELPSKLGHSSEELGARLQSHARHMAEDYNIKTESHAIASTDPAAEVDGALLKAVKDTGCDLVVMGSHQPGWMEYIFSSHAGHMAQHAKVSVFVVR
ncbi:universal stress protein [Aliiroseovarius sp. YM-037]|uniref:universal stress protein n=1 Tax=Aliiroseovarius sp. YM-037 TaxID=3341728 RepID=UPI003A80DFF8